VVFILSLRYRVFQIVPQAKYGHRLVNIMAGNRRPGQDPDWTGGVTMPGQVQDPFSWQSDSIFCKPNYPLLADLKSFFLLDSSD
jgi:hypothetical protein